MFIVGLDLQFVRMVFVCLGRSSAEELYTGRWRREREESCNPSLLNQKRYTGGQMVIKCGAA